MNLDMQNDDYKDNFKILLYKQKGQTMQFGRKNNPFCPYIRKHISNFLNKSVRTNIYWTHISICLESYNYLS